MTSNKTQITIDWSQYSDESNDPGEVGLRPKGKALTLGPLKPDGSGDRIPYSGFEDDENVYIVIGWPTKLVRPTPSFNRDIVAWLQKVLGKGYPQFCASTEMQARLAARIAKDGIGAVKRDWLIGRNEKELGPVQSLQYAISDDAGSEEPTITPKYDNGTDNPKPYVPPKDKYPPKAPMKLHQAIPSTTKGKKTGLEGLGE